MDISLLATIGAVFLAAGAVKGVSGMGLPTLAMALLGLVLPPATAAALMVVVAWLIERLCLSRLVNQDGITLLMATLGITYFLEGAGQAIFGNDIYKIDIGMPKDPILVLE